MRRLFCLLLLTAPSAASAGGVVQTPVAPSLSVLPVPGLAVPVAPRLSSFSPALAAPILPSVSLSPVTVPTARARALPVPAIAAAPPAAAGAAPGIVAVPEGRPLASAAKAVASTVLDAAPAADARGGVGAVQARGTVFFDGARVFPDMVNHVGVDGFVRELREPAKQLQAMGIKGTVTVYGSARIPSREDAQALYDAAVARHGKRPADKAGRAEITKARAALRASHWYEEARRFGRLVVENSGGELAVVHGGGGGIMAGAGQGAIEGGGRSVGYNITLPHEQKPTKWISPGLAFEFENFTTRKMNLRHGAVGLTYFPGGFGTFDELFEVLTLIQTGKMARVPIVLVGKKSYWQKVIRFSEFASQGLISKEDLDLFIFAENAEQAWAAIAEGADRR